MILRNLLIVATAYERRLNSLSHISLLRLSCASLYFDALFFPFFFSTWLWLSCASLYYYGVATISRLFKIVGLFFKRALQKWLYSAKETYNFKEPTNRSHTILEKCLSTLTAMYVSLFSRPCVLYVTFIVACVSVLWKMSHTSLYLDGQVRLFTLTLLFFSFF